jgi:hypothetical protein
MTRNALEKERKRTRPKKTIALGSLRHAFKALDGAVTRDAA